jgi:hypothetical protein
MMTKIAEYKNVPARYIWVAGLLALVYSLTMVKPEHGIRTLTILVPSVLVGGIIMIVAHELLHGVLFKLYTGRVIFGFLPRRLAFYASSPGAIISRNWFVLICLIPQILAVPCFLVAYISSNPLIVYIAVTIFVFNLLCGVSDWWIAFRVAHYSSDILVKDTLDGVTIYRREYDLFR